MTTQSDLIDVCDHVADALAMVGMIFMAGDFLKAEGIVRSAADVEHSLKGAAEKLKAVRAALDGSPVIPKDRMGRLSLVADTLEVPMPVGVRADLLGADGAPAKAVLRFCIDTGASLDFIYLGDIRPMLRSLSRYERKAA